MSRVVPTPSHSQSGKRSELVGGALTDETLASSPSLLRAGRGGRLVGLQQFYAAPEAAELIAGANGTGCSTLDLTAGDGALLAPLERELRFGIEIDRDQLDAGDYEGIHADVQRAYPLLRLVGAQFPRVACNPPFGLDWARLNALVRVPARTFLLEREERKIGIGLALVASLGITYGGWLATRERPTAAAPPRAARRAASSCGLVVRGVEMRVAWIRATDLAAV